MTTVTIGSEPTLPDRNARAAWRSLPTHYDRRGLQIGDQQVVQFWEREVMETMGRAVAANGGRILEIGYGLGLSANAIATTGCDTHTLIEAHPEVAQRARLWSANQPRPTKLIEAFWEECVADLADASFDGILFDTCPVSEAERNIWYRGFLPHAARLLRPGGVFSYFAHQAAPGPLRDWPILSRYFSRIEQPLTLEVAPYPDCQYWHQSTLLVPLLYR